MISLEDYDRFEIPPTLPCVPVRDLVIFPYTIVPLFVNRPISISAIEEAWSSHHMVLLATQRDSEKDNPGTEDLYRIGTVGMVMRMRRLGDGRLKVLVQGLVRGRIESLDELGSHILVRTSSIYDLPLSEISIETEALIRSLREKLQEYADFSKEMGSDVLVVLQGVKDPGRLADLVASNLPLPLHLAQAVLETPDPIRRLRSVTEYLARELDLAKTKTRIENRTKEKLGQAQHEFFLREQLKQIKTELGEEASEEEMQELENRIGQCDMPEEVRKEARKQLGRLSKMPMESSESQVTRTYLEWLLDLCWQGITDDRLDLKRVKEVLDEDHWGLEEAKDRILEFLSVRKLNPQNPGAILLLVGPPGVGKTSLGRSIARALNRKFVRASLGGVHDEAEIRGHRRTYVGAMPGRIIQGMKQAGSTNPVFVLDELDKLGRDFRGDPASALLEVLDPEQNHAFVDHYLNVAYDLSRVMFIATANRTDTIPPPLLDRMEEIRLPGYTPEEKLAIAYRHLVPHQRSKCGLTEKDLELPKETLERMIERHTREAGLRQLERSIAQVYRKVARRIAEDESVPGCVQPDDLRNFLGPAIHLPTELLAKDSVGIANGLAWTPMGGEIIQVEAVAMVGRGQLILTGQLGEVMKESAHAALSYTRSLAAQLGLTADFFSQHDVHIHVPAGAIPKDGPSAGVTMAVSLISLLTGIPVRRNVALTGEISLGGRLLAVSGLREKILAALRVGFEEVIVPAQNLDELDLISPDIFKKIHIHGAGSISDAAARALVKIPWHDVQCQAASGRRESKPLPQTVASNQLA